LKKQGESGSRDMHTASSNISKKTRMLMFQKFNFTNQKETITEERLWAGTKPLFLDVTVEQYQLLVGGQESYRRVITVNFDYN
jgi:hypothetical protein